MVVLRVSGAGCAECDLSLGIDGWRGIMDKAQQSRTLTSDQVAVIFAQEER